MSIFDGMTGALADALGAPVNIIPSSGAAPFSVVAIFRRRPVLLETRDGGAVRSVECELSVPGDRAQDILVGDHVLPGDGVTYRIASSDPSGSSSEDAFVNFYLEKVQT